MKLPESVRQYLPDIIRICNVFLMTAVVFYGYFAFFTSNGLEYVFRNWDGPGYAVVARTLYDVKEIEAVNPFPFLAPSHYAYQFPLYPLFIRLFSFVGYNVATIGTSQLFALLYSISLYILVKTVNPKANALFVAVASIFITPRWFIVSHVGSTEPLFMLCVTLFALFFYKKQFGLSAIFGALAQLTKPQGIFLFLAIILYAVYIVWIGRKASVIRAARMVFPYLLIPLSLLGIFWVYYVRFGDFFIFLRNEAFPTMQWPPLLILTSKTVYNAVIDLFVVWKEAIVYTYLLYLIGIGLLWEKGLKFFSVTALLYFLPVLLFVQTDMARFILPILPLVILGFSDALSKKSVMAVIMLSSPMMMLYAIGYINYNLAPYPATLFLR